MLGPVSLGSLGVAMLATFCLVATRAALIRTPWQWSLTLDGLLAATMLLHLVAAPYRLRSIRLWIFPVVCGPVE